MIKLIASLLLIAILWFIIIPLSFGILVFFVKAFVLIVAIYAVLELIAIIRGSSRGRKIYRR